MVWFVTILSGLVLFTTSIPDEGYLRALGWGVATAGMVLLMGRLGVWFIWERDEDQGRRRE